MLARTISVSVVGGGTDTNFAMIELDPLALYEYLRLYDALTEAAKNTQPPPALTEPLNSSDWLAENETLASTVASVS